MNRRLLIFLFLLPALLRAQIPDGVIHKIDSLNNLIQKEKNDTLLIRHLFSLDDIIYPFDSKKDEEINKRIDEICQKHFKIKSTPDKLKTALKKYRLKAMNNLGIIYMMRNKNEIAEYYYKESLAMANELGDRESQSKTFVNLGILRYQAGDIDRSIEYYDKGLKVLEQTSNHDAVASILNNLALIYRENGDTAIAIEYYNRSIELSRKVKSYSRTATSLVGLADIYNKRGEKKKVVSMLLESKALAKKTGDIRNMVAADMNLGNFFLENGRFSEAIPLFEEGLILSRSQQDERTYALVQSLQAELYYRLNQPEMALLKADSAFKTLMKYRLIKEAIEPAKHLYQLHKKSNPLLALEMLEKYLELKDTLEKESNQRAVIQRQYKIKYEKQFAADSIKSAEYKRIQDAEVKQKEAEVKQKETELIAKRKEQYLLFGGLVLIIIFSIFIFNRFQITRKQKNVIAIQKELVEEKNKEIMDSINYARRLQEAILPPHKLVKEYLPDSFILYKPKDIVAGDFYWMESVGNTIFFAAADCTGHGVPGALVSVVCSNALTKALMEEKITTPGKMLDRTRDLVIEQFARSEQEVKDGMDISLCSLTTSPDPSKDGERVKLQWAGANNPLWIIRSGELLEAKADKQPIGKYADNKPFTNHNIELQKGDTIYIFTDGYQDQFGGDKGKKYKASNLKTFLISIVHEPAAKQRELLIQEFERWKGNNEQIDDVCLIGVRI